MDSAISPWKKIKRSGHFKRAVKKNYQRIIGSHNSLGQASVEAATPHNSFVYNHGANLEVTATTASSDTASEQAQENVNSQVLVDEDNIYTVNEECMDTDAEKNIMHPLSEIEKKIEIKKQLKI